MLQQYLRACDENAHHVVHPGDLLEGGARRGSGRGGGGKGGRWREGMRQRDEAREELIHVVCIRKQQQKRVESGGAFKITIREFNKQIHNAAINTYTEEFNAEYHL